MSRARWCGPCLHRFVWQSWEQDMHGLVGLVFTLGLTCAVMAAAGQGVSAPARSGPPAGAVGPALPFALAEGVRPLPRAGAGRMAEYLAGEVEGAVPSIVPGDTPDLASASGLED